MDFQSACMVGKRGCILSCFIVDDSGDSSYCKENRCRGAEVSFTWLEFGQQQNDEDKDFGSRTAICSASKS